MTTFKVTIRDLIAAGKLDDALHAAKQQAVAGLTELDTPATLLSSEFEYLKQSVIRGVLTHGEETAKRQSIAFRLIEIVNSLPDGNLAQPGQMATADKTVVLFMGANPFQKLALELDREVQEISAGLSRFGKRQNFDFRAKVHVTPTDLQRMLLESELAPRFVHFAGSAVVDHPDYGTGIIFEDENGQPRTISGAVLATIFKQFPSVECVFLNTCDSGPSALAIGAQVRYAVGMNALIYDQSAIVFAVAFYEAIASGNDVPFAFEFAKGRLQLEKYPGQASVPVLIVNGVCKDPVYVPGKSHLAECARPTLAER